MGTMLESTQPKLTDSKPILSFNNMNQLSDFVNIWEGMTLDQINKEKEELQKLMPLVNLLKNKQEPYTCKGMERDQTLRLMGYTNAEIEEMTGFKQEPRPAKQNEGENVLDELASSYSKQWKI